jgi:hypothetical protein
VLASGTLRAWGREPKGAAERGHAQGRAAGPAGRKTGEGREGEEASNQWGHRVRERKREEARLG